MVCPQIQKSFINLSSFHIISPNIFPQLHQERGQCENFINFGSVFPEFSPRFSQFSHPQRGHTMPLNAEDRHVEPTHESRRSAAAGRRCGGATPLLGPGGEWWEEGSSGVDGYH